VGSSRWNCAVKNAIALVAHDAKKDAMIRWATANRQALLKYRLYATGTTGQRPCDEVGLEVCRLRSGPLGGDAQIGAMIAERKLSALVFFVDPLSAMPHDVDVKSLLRRAILYDTLLALNEASTTAIFSNALEKGEGI